MGGPGRGQAGVYRQRGGGYNVVRSLSHSQTVSSVSNLSTPNNTFNVPKVRESPDQLYTYTKVASNLEILMIDLFFPFFQTLKFVHVCKM